MWVYIVCPDLSVGKFRIITIWAPSRENLSSGLQPGKTRTCLKTSLSLEILAIGSIGIILSRQQTTKVLIRLRGCAGWSAPLLFAYAINRFPHDVAHIDWAGAWQTNKMTWSHQRLISAWASAHFAVRSKDSQEPKVSLCGQRRLWSAWSDWMDTQADLSLC